MIVSAAENLRNVYDEEEKEAFFLSHMIIMVYILVYSLSVMAKYDTACLDCFVGKSTSDFHQVNCLGSARLSLLPFANNSITFYHSYSLRYSV